MGFAQLTGSHQVALPSPEAASLAKQAEASSDLFRGSPSLNIPLFNFDNHGLKVPLSLHYGSNGIRVDEIAGWTGLGWTLNAGGAITRIKRGSADEWSNGYMQTGDNPDFVNFKNLPPLDQYQFLTNYLGDIVDPEPDIFYYNFPGGSGKFLIAPGGEVYTIPQSALRIELGPVSGDVIQSFTIYTPNGTKYFFSEKELSIESGSYVIWPDFVSSWYLTKIESAQGDEEISLSYSSAHHVAHETPQYEAKYQGFGIDSPSPSLVKENLLQSYQRIYLETISSPAYTATFNRSLRDDALHPTDDDQQEYRLDSINIRHAGTGKEVKTVQFGYSYQSDRLFLDWVKTKASNIELPSHRFQYISPDDLPERLSFATDHWGYYNGATSNTTYIPAMVEEIQGDYNYYQGANRSPDPFFTEYGMLQRVDYPQGGYTEFEYEACDYGKVLTPRGTDLIDSQKSQYQFTGTTVGTAESFTFSVQSDTGVDSYVSINMRFEVIDPNGVYVRLYDADSSTLLKSYTPDDLSPDDGGPSYRPIATDEFALPDGNYRLDIKRMNQADLVTADLDVHEEQIVLKKTGGGVRVKTIISHDGITTQNDVKKHFSYGQGSESWGIMYTEPAYDYWFIPGKIGTGGSMYFWARVSTPVRMYGGEGRKFMGHSKVVVSTKTDMSQGSQEHQFTNTIPNFPGRPSLSGSGWNQGVFMAQSNAGYRLGLPAETAVLDNNSELVNKKIQSYIFYDLGIDDDRLYKEFPAIAWYEFGASPSGNKNFKFMPYTMVAPWRYLQTTNDKIFNSGTSAQETTTNYSYENFDHKQLTKTTETNSDGTKRITEYHYAHEQNPAMVGLNMLSQPYSVTLKDSSGAVLSKQWTRWSDGTGWWRPTGKWIWEGGNPDVPVFNANN